MKKIFYITILSLVSILNAHAQTETTLSQDKKNYLYKIHKKQLAEQNKAFQEEKYKKGITTDNTEKAITDVEIVDFSSGKPVKKQ